MNRKTFKLWDRPEYHDPSLTDAVEVGDTLYLAGQCGQCPVTGKWGVGFEEQAVLVWKNIQFILGKFGLDCSSIVATTTFLSDPADGDQFVQVSNLFIPKGTTVATTCVASDRWDPILLLETAAIARLDLAR
jgi:enamine deaminase RidA (YjgF/YER057c/UK114 family)